MKKVFYLLILCPTIIYGQERPTKNVASRLEFGKFLEEFSQEYKKAKNPKKDSYETQAEFEARKPKALEEFYALIERSSLLLRWPVNPSGYSADKGTLTLSSKKFSQRFYHAGMNQNITQSVPELMVGYAPTFIGYLVLGTTTIGIPSQVHLGDEYHANIFKIEISRDKARELDVMNTSKSHDLFITLMPRGSTNGPYFLVYRIQYFAGDKLAWSYE